MPTKLRITKTGKAGVSPQQKHGTANQLIGMGYIFVPDGVDRTQYIETCFRKKRVDVIGDSDGTVFIDCYILQEALQNIQFPEESGKMGSPVVWVSMPLFSQPVVIGTFPNTTKIPIRGEEEFSVRRTFKKGMVSIEGDAKDGTLVINVKGNEFGVVKVAVEGGENSVMDVFSEGNVRIAANKEIAVTAYEILKTKVVDPETMNESGLEATKDTVTMKSTYGDAENEDDRDFTSTTVTKDGFVTETKIGDVSYKQTVNKDKNELVFQDCSITFEDGTLTLKQGEATLEIKDNKISFTNNGTGLNDILSKLNSAIQNLTVSTSTGPSGTPLPPTVQATTEISQLLNNFFNG